jgi:glycosyltransferase involved in cell wall biosynthesis
MTIERKYSILHTESSLGWGGQEIRVLMESSEFKRRGHNVIIACHPDSQLYKRSKDTGIKTVAIEMGKKFNSSACFNLLRLIKREEVDFINTHSSGDSWSGSLAAKIAGVGLVRTRHIDVPVSDSFINFIYKLPACIITTSEAIKDKLIAHGVSGKKVFTIPTGVDLEKYKPEEGKESLKIKLGIAGKKPVITNVAVLRSWKGHRFLINSIPEVVKHFPEAVFLIVGDGPQRNTLEKQVEELKLQSWVVLTGHRDDIPDMLNVSDLFVLSSTKYEGVPQALLQAMATNLPVVATNVAGVKDIVKFNETGLLVNPESALSLAEGIVSILNDKDTAKMFAENGRKLVKENYSLEKMTESLEKVYTNLISNESFF